jgi:hypothetical protein
VPHFGVLADLGLIRPTKKQLLEYRDLWHLAWEKRARLLV